MKRLVNDLDDNWQRFVNSFIFIVAIILGLVEFRVFFLLFFGRV